LTPRRPERSACLGPRSARDRVDRGVLALGSGMGLDLTEEETLALLDILAETIENDR